MPFPIGDQSCSTWALSGDESRETSVHREFSELTDHLLNINRRELGDNLQAQRLEAMRQIAALRDETEYPVEEIYLCGGFMRENDLVPSHYWIEDRTHGITTDTFINRDSVVVLDGVGVDGEEFRPGCEGDAFEPEQIVRTRITGYTKGQVDILTNYNRPEDVVDAVIQTKRDEIASSTRLRDENQHMLDNIARFPHRNTHAGRQTLRENVDKYNNQILEKQQELVELELNRPVRPALPESDDGPLIDITAGPSRLRTAMQGAIQARQGLVEEAEPEVIAPEVIEQPQSSSLLRGLTSTLGKFVLGVTAIAVVASTLYNSVTQNDL